MDVHNAVRPATEPRITSKQKWHISVVSFYILKTLICHRFRMEISQKVTLVNFKCLKFK